MPHIKADRREACLSLENVKAKGELHYFFGQQMQKMFLSNPCYDTISDIRRFFVQEARSQKYFKDVRKAFQTVSLDFVLNEAALAWDEFHSCVVHPYEEYKALSNKPHAYQPSLDYIRGKMQEAIKEQQANALIIPK